MKIFITGASGFIGRHLVKKLLKDGHEITINLYEDEINPFGEDVNAYKFGNKQYARSY
jgi:nucleoside-diphosphate-sugar epimerase